MQNQPIDDAKPNSTPTEDPLLVKAEERQNLNRALQYSVIAAIAIIASPVCFVVAREIHPLSSDRYIWLGLSILFYLIAIFARWGSLMLWQRTTISAPAQLWFRWALGSYSIAFVCSLVAMILSFQQWQVPELLISTLIVCDIACSYFALVFQNIGWHYWASRLGDKDCTKLVIYKLTAVTIFLFTISSMQFQQLKPWIENSLISQLLVIISLLTFCAVYAMQLIALSCLIHNLTKMTKQETPKDESPFVD